MADMTPSGFRQLGKRDGLRYSITWLHQRANQMNDPHAKAVLNSAAYALGNEIREGHIPTPSAEKYIPSDDDLAAAIKPIWLKVKPSHEAQKIRSALSVEFDDKGLKQWMSDFIPEYVWDLIEIAAERGIAAERAEARQR